MVSAVVEVKVFVMIGGGRNSILFLLAWSCWDIGVSSMTVIFWTIDLGFYWLIYVVFVGLCWCYCFVGVFDSFVWLIRGVNYLSIFHLFILHFVYACLFFSVMFWLFDGC